ncbi:MAG: zinc ribbon domain-containing protein [Raoultibacter sp.]
MIEPVFASVVLKECLMFCIACGTQLPDNAKFCPECGSAVVSLNLAETIPSIELEQEDKGGNSQPGHPAIDLPVIADPSMTLRLPKIDPESGEVLQTSTDQQKNYVQSSAVPRGWTPQKIVLLIALIAVALALFFFASQLLLQNFSRAATAFVATPPTATQEDQEASGSSAEKKVSADEMASTKMLDEIYSEINIAYANVADYNSQIDDIVTDFNSWYLASSLSSRQEAAARCTKLSTKIMTAQDSLSKKLTAAGCDKGSVYSDEAQRIDELFNLLNKRVGTIGESWKIDVSYENPAGHEDEILAPIAKADIAGKSKYLTQFEAAYPPAKPEKLH